MSIKISEATFKVKKLKTVHSKWRRITNRKQMMMNLVLVHPDFPGIRITAMQQFSIYGTNIVHLFGKYLITSPECNT